MKSNASKNSTKNVTAFANVSKNSSNLALIKKNVTSNATNLAQEGLYDHDTAAVAHRDTMLVLSEDGIIATTQQNTTMNTTTLSQSIINMTKNGTANHSKNRSASANATTFNSTGVKMIQRQAKNQKTIGNLVKSSSQVNATVVNQKASVKLNDVKKNVSTKDVDIKVLK